MSPSIEHEWYHRALGRMVETLTEELEIPILARRFDHAQAATEKTRLGAGRVLYLEHELQMHGKQGVGPHRRSAARSGHRSGHLRSSLDKLSIYADLGVPELWFYNGESLVVRRLRDGVYVKRDRSDSFPFLDLKEIERFMGRFEQLGETAWIRSFRNWVKTSYGHLAS